MNEVEQDMVVDAFLRKGSPSAVPVPFYRAFWVQCPRCGRYFFGTRYGRRIIRYIEHYYEVHA